MGKIFLTVLNMSFTASYVILFVILVRLMLKKAPRVISYVLWGVVALFYSVFLIWQGDGGILYFRDGSFRSPKPVNRRRNLDDKGTDDKGTYDKGTGVLSPILPMCLVLINFGERKEPSPKM
jgi:hypothetical protein